MTDTITLPRATVQQALDALEDPMKDLKDLCVAMEALRAALEQQAEPVAWMTHSHDLLPLFHRTERAALVWGAEPTPLYTASPQRKEDE